MKTTLLPIAIVLLTVFATGTPVASVGSVTGVTGVQEKEMIDLKGCLLLSRRVGVYALHMEYNRVTVKGHPNLPNYVSHMVMLTGAFETEGDYLYFIVDEITDIAPTCEAQASVTVLRGHHA